MIGRITGKLIEKSPPLVCVDVNGIGYDIDVPMSTFYDLPELGQTVTLFTHMIVREDAHSLFGFASATDRKTFKTLLKVSGIGARSALAILSSSSSQDLAAAVERQDAAFLVKIPGIGKKTAERLLLELRGKLEVTSMTPLFAGDSQQDIMDALLALGYSEKESAKTIKALPDGLSVTEGIKQALKLISQ